MFQVVCRGSSRREAWRPKMIIRIAVTFIVRLRESFLVICLVTIVGDLSSVVIIQLVIVLLVVIYDPVFSLFFECFFFGFLGQSSDGIFFP